MTLNGVIAVTLRYFTEFGKPVFQHITASICGKTYAPVYYIFIACTMSLWKKVHVRYLISWWVSCITGYGYRPTRDQSNCAIWCFYVSKTYLFILVWKTLDYFFRALLLRGKVCLNAETY